MTYRHTPEMGEISGFGGDYEKTCQDMLEAGVIWLDAHQKPDLKGHGYQDVYGIMITDSDDAKALEKAIMAPPTVTQYGATGAMHQAVMSRLFWIAKNGWDAYCAELVKREAEETSA